MSAEFHVRAAQGAAGGDPVPCYVDCTQLPVPVSRRLCADHFGVNGPVRLDAILQGDLGETDPQKTTRKRAALLLERAADILDSFREVYFNGDSSWRRFPGAYHPRPNKWANADFLDRNIGEYLDHALKLLGWLGHEAFARDCREKLTTISAALREMPVCRPDMDEVAFNLWAAADLGLLRLIELCLADLREFTVMLWPDSEQTRDPDTCCIEHAGKVWKFRFEGESHSVETDLKGMLDIAHLIQNSGKACTARALFNPIQESGLGHAFDGRGRRELQQAAEAARAAGEIDDALEIEAYLTKQGDARGRARRLSDPKKKAGDAIRSRISRAMNTLASSFPALHTHIVDRLRLRDPYKFEVREGDPTFLVKL